MSRHNFFVAPDLLKGDTVRLTGEPAHRIANVLRLKNGDSIYLLDGSGFETEAQIINISRDNVAAVVLSRQKANTEPLVEITLCQALIPHDRFEFVLEKGTELGVCRFIPCISERCTAQPPRNASDKARKLARWQGVIQAAAEQSRRACLPEIVAPLTYTEALNALKLPLLIAWEEETTPLQPTLQHLAEVGIRSLSLLVGPEGGLTTGEIALARKLGADIVSLGPRILRAETAGIAFSAITAFTLGSLSGK